LEQKNLETQIVYDDEIDLYELFLTLKKRWKVIALTTLIFFTFAVIYIFIAKPVYKSDFIINNIYKYESNDKPTVYIFIIEKGSDNQIIKEPLLSPNEIKLLIDRLSKLIEQNKYNQLAKLLNINENLAKDLKDVKVNTDRKDKTFMKIEIYAYSNKNFKRFETAILDYLNNNPYVQKEIRLEKEKIISDINNIDKVINKIEKLRGKIEKMLNNKSNILGFNPADIDIKIANLKSKKKELEEQLKELKFESKVSVFTPDKPYKPKKALILAVSLVTGLIFGIFLAFFLEWLEGVKNRGGSEVDKAV